MNLSGKTMNDPDIADDLAAMVAALPDPRRPAHRRGHRDRGDRRTSNGPASLAAELRTLGCRFALDDFGAGFASFYYLKHLDFDYLKIDGEFITKLTDNPTDQLIVKALVDIAHGLGTKTVAEFVGDEATVRAATRARHRLRPGLPSRTSRPAR